MRLKNRNSFAMRVLQVSLLVLVLCVLSSAAFKFSPRKQGAGAVQQEGEEDSSAEVQVVGGNSASSLNLEARKKGSARDYVFAKVNNPKLVRPKGKNSRTEDDDDDEDVDGTTKVSAAGDDSGENDDDDKDDDEDDDGDSGDADEVSEAADDEVVIRRADKMHKPVVAVKNKKREQNDDKNSLGKQQKKKHQQSESAVDEDADEDEDVNGDDKDDDDDDDDDLEEKQVAKGKEKVKDKEKPKKKESLKHKIDDQDDDNEVENKKNMKKKSKKPETDDEDDRETGKKNKKSKNSDDDDEPEKKKKKKSNKPDEDEEVEKEKKQKKKSKSKDEDVEDRDSKKKDKKNKKKSKDEDNDDDQDNDSPWWDIFGFFGKDKEEESFLEVIQKKRDEENEKIRKKNELSEKKKEAEKKINKKKDDQDEEEGVKSWLSYLNRKPFNFLFDFDGEEEEQSEDEKRDTEPEKGTLEMKKKGKKSGPLSTEDFEEILAYIPSFVPNYTSIENIDCRRQGQIFHRQLRGQKLWAFQMIDAGGKIGSGILHGNINQLGNFDLCTEISTKVKITEETMVRVKGKYCLAHLDIQATDDNLKYLMHLINGKSLLRSTIDDPSHFVPRFTTFNWGVCVPAACTVDDVQEFLEASLEDYNSTGIKLNIEIDEENCYVAHKFHLDKLLKENFEIVVILGCVTSILVLVVIATLNQYWTHWRGASIVIEILDGQGSPTEDEMISFNESSGEPEPHGLLTSLILQFSLKDTWTQLTSTKEGEIECLHGIKAVAAIGLFSIFKVLQLIRAPYSNRVDLTEILNSSWSLILRSPMLFMDVFLIISGFVTSYSLLKRFEQTGKFTFISSFIGKLIRMIPLIALTTLFQAHIWPHLGSGPQWNEIVGTHAKLCGEKWWKNLLFLQTTDKIEDACDPISYQFGVQMGMLLISPGLIWAMTKKPQIGLAVFGALNALSVSMRFSKTQADRLAPVFYHGIKMTQIYRTMDLDHGSIVLRMTPFINGLALGWIVLQFGNRVKIPRTSKITLWVSSLAGICWCLFSQTHVTKRDYVYDAGEMAQFGAWVPLVWSYSIMWIIFACYSGNGNFLNRLLSAKPLVFISRISFALHFVQYFVLSSVSAQTRAVGHFEISHFVNTFELFVIVFASVFLTLTFDLPMQNIRDILKTIEWVKEAEPVTEETNEAGDSQVSDSEDKKPLFKSNGSVESSSFDWGRSAKESSVGSDKANMNNHRSEPEEHLDSFGKDEGKVSDPEEEIVVEEEEEEEEYSEEEVAEHEGGNSAPLNEELDDFWGSDNE